MLQIINCTVFQINIFLAEALLCVVFSCVRGTRGDSRSPTKGVLPDIRIYLFEINLEPKLDRRPISWKLKKIMYSNSMKQNISS
jgi:hypothetical protein